MKDIVFTTLKLKNFLSTGNVVQEITLNQNLLTLILGINADSDAGMRNGAGKTTILQAVCFALYGKPLTKIKIPNLVNNINGKGCFVSLEFEAGDITYRIERGLKPSFTRYFVDNSEIKQDAEDEAQGENRKTQIDINRIVGLSLRMFRHILGLNTFSDPFLREKANEAREIIEELFGIMQLSERAEILRDQITKTKDGVKTQEASIKATTEANSRIEVALRNAEATDRKWTRDREATITKLAEEIEALAGIDYDAELETFDALDLYQERERTLQATVNLVAQEYVHVQKTVDAHEKEAARYKSSLAAQAGSGVNRIDSEIKRRKADLARCEQRLGKHRSDLLTLEQTPIDDHQKCSSCGQDIADTSHLERAKARHKAKIDNLAATIAADEAEFADHENEIMIVESERVEAIETEKTMREKLQQQAADALTEADKHRSARDAAKAALDLAKADLAQLGTRPQTMFDSRDQVYATREMRNTLERDLEQETIRANPYVDQIVALRDTLQKIDYSALNEGTTLLKHQEFLLKLLTSKDSFIRKKIVDQNLAYLNGRLSFYLEKLALPHGVVFQSDLSVEITHLGRDYDYEQLSRGEMNRVNLAMSWAFRDVWEGLNHQINLLWVDELLDQGTDTQGVEAALGILKGMGRDRGKNVFLVSHKDELKSRIDSILLVKKSNEFTEFEENATV